MINRTRIKLVLVMVAGLLGAGLSCVAQAGTAFIQNPSFESNLNTNGVVAGHPDGWPYYSSIDGWNGGSGVNDLVYDPSGPFANAGTPVPDGRRIGFKQGTGTVTQDISGLTPGQLYWLQFFYDVRTGSDLDLAVRFSTVNQGGNMDDQLDIIQSPKPAITTKAPYYFRNVPFTPDLDSGTITFEVTARGDATALFDAVTIVPGNAGNFAIQNPSFEASGVVYDGAPSAGLDWPAIGGWAKTGTAGVDDGTGGVADNGAIPDQALVVFITGQGSLSQTLDPLVTASSYQLQFACNAKSGTTPHLQVLLDGAVIWEKDVTAVGGTQPYLRQTVSFTATNETSQITFSNTVANATVLLDDVKLVGKTGTRLPPMQMAPAKILLRAGGEATATVTIPTEKLALGPAVIKLGSADTNVFILPDADATGILSLQFQTTNTLSYRVRALTVGNAAVNIADPAGLILPSAITTIYVAGTTFVLNPSFESDPDSGVANAPVTAWTTAGATIGMAGPGNAFLSSDDLTTPDRNQVLRVQGSGTVSQNIAGLKPGQLYGLQFFYNRRSSGYDPSITLSLTVSVGGQQLTNWDNLVPASQNGLTDYYFQELRFTPSAATNLLEFKTSASGDATLFLDAVSIVPRLANEITVMNSSFEGSADGIPWPGYFQPTRLAGWTCAGGNYGINAYSPKTFFTSDPFFDNGINSDQDNVFFGQGATTADQTVTGLTAGQSYTLVFDYNFRDGRAQGSTNALNPEQVQVSMDGNVVSTSTAALPVDTVTPWTGFEHSKPMYQMFLPFTAAGQSTDLQLAHVNIVGDETLLIDNVRILPGSHTPPSITQQLAAQNVQAGAPASFSVTASGSNLSYRWFVNGVPLLDGGTITGSSTAKLTISSAQVTDAGTYTVLVSDGVGMVGSVADLTVQGPVTNNVSLSAQLTAGNLVITWPATATGYRLQHAAALPTASGAWADETTPAVQVGNNWQVQITPVGSQQYYRLTQ